MEMALLKRRYPSTETERMIGDYGHKCKKYTYKIFGPQVGGR